jgi:hypothetical protein
VVDPDGRYDASSGGDVPGLHWVIRGDTVELAQLKDKYYEPNLLARLLGHSKEKLAAVKDLDNIRLHPAVSVAQTSKKKPVFKIKLTNRGGGYGPVTVRLNGKDVKFETPPKAAGKDETREIEVDLSKDPRFAPGVRNEVEVVASNAEETLKSRAMTTSFDDGGKPPTEKPRLYAVVAGVSTYKASALNLRYAAKDADDIAAALKLAGSRLLGAERVEVKVLSSSQKGEENQPSRANLIKAMEAMSKVKPQDVVIVYLAGHGVNEKYEAEKRDYFYLTSDTDSEKMTPDVLKKTTISSVELTDLLKKAPAMKQVLILDTCASGKLIDKLTEKREVPSVQKKAVERLKDSTGMYILAGCTADAVSYESCRFGQGLLTYSLLLGIKGGALGDNGEVDISKLCHFASNEVERQARNIGGVQTPVVGSPRASRPFPIGLVTKLDLEKIPLGKACPLVLRAEFQDDNIEDALGLAKRVNENMRAAADKGGTRAVIHINAEEMVDAWSVRGRYSLDKKTNKVTAKIRLAREGRPGTVVTVEGQVGEVDKLVRDICIEVRKTVHALDAGK